MTIDPSFFPSIKNPWDDDVGMRIGKMFFPRFGTWDKAKND